VKKWSLIIAKQTLYESHFLDSKVKKALKSHVSLGGV